MANGGGDGHEVKKCQQQNKYGKISMQIMRASVIHFCNVHRPRSSSACSMLAQNFCHALYKHTKYTFDDVQIEKIRIMIEVNFNELRQWITDGQRTNVCKFFVRKFNACSFRHMAISL